MKNNGAFNTIISVLSFIAAYAIGRFLGLVVLIFIGAWAIGGWFPKWYMQREKVNGTLVKWIVWSNSVTWLLPPLGVMTSFSALGFSDYFPSDTRKYKTIAIIGLAASLLNAFSGILKNI